VKLFTRNIQSPGYRARRYASKAYDVVVTRLSVRPSVCHKPALAWQTTPNGRGQGDELFFLILPPIIRTHDILPPKGMCSESRDLFKFLQISDNISETVQDRNIVAV